MSAAPSKTPNQLRLRPPLSTTASMKIHAEAPVRLRAVRCLRAHTCGSHWVIPSTALVSASTFDSGTSQLDAPRVGSRERRTPHGESEMSVDASNVEDPIVSQFIEVPRAASQPHSRSRSFVLFSRDQRRCQMMINFIAIVAGQTSDSRSVRCPSGCLPTQRVRHSLVSPSVPFHYPSESMGFASEPQPIVLDPRPRFKRNSAGEKSAITP